LQRAFAARQQLAASDTFTAYRLVHAESDGLPGVILDRYGEFLVCQFLSAGAEYWKHTLVEQIAELIQAKGVYERSDVNVRQKENLSPAAGVLAGEQPPETVEIREGALRFLVDLRHGHKTGFYLDQRENRAALADYVQDKEVLNCFAYTGGFGISALKNGARKVVNIESSESAIDLARRNADLNALDAAKIEYVQDNVFGVLRGYRKTGRQFDLIILDPPKFADSRSALKRASRGYKDINLLAMQLLKPGGILFTFSCSGILSPELFQKIVADAALDANKNAQILEYLSQAPDHPIALNFPEGEYLKGLICKVL
jgi:23S rRNA (cytosine1962-C5)-methyltransferase